MTLTPELVRAAAVFAATAGSKPDKMRGSIIFNAYEHVDAALKEAVMSPLNSAAARLTKRPSYATRMTSSDGAVIEEEDGKESEDGYLFHGGADSRRQMAVLVQVTNGGGQRWYITASMDIC